MFNFDVVAAHQEFCDSETPAFISGDEIRQVFTSLENFLYRIELLFSSNSVAGDGRLKAYSVDSGSSSLSFSASWPACGRSERRMHGKRWLPEGGFHRPSAEANGSAAPAVTIT